MRYLLCLNQVAHALEKGHYLVSVWRPHSQSRYSHTVVNLHEFEINPSTVPGNVLIVAGQSSTASHSHSYPGSPGSIVAVYVAGLAANYRVLLLPLAASRLSVQVRASYFKGGNNVAIALFFATKSTARLDLLRIATPYSAVHLPYQHLSASLSAAQPRIEFSRAIASEAHEPAFQSSPPSFDCSPSYLRRLISNVKNVGLVTRDASQTRFCSFLSLSEGGPTRVRQAGPRPPSRININSPFP